MSKSNKLTLINDYFDLHNEYEEIYGKGKTVLFMQIGSFYEAYATEDEGYDLFKLSDILNIAVSRKNKKNKKLKEINYKNPYMLGFPTLASYKYLKILIDYGFTVPLVDQVDKLSDKNISKKKNSTKKLKYRELTRIYSAGTEIDNITTSDSNNILSVYIEEEKQLKNNSNILCIGLSIIDLSIGKSIVNEVFSKNKDDKYSLDEIIRFMNAYNPKEIIIYIKKLFTITKEQLILYLDLDNKNYFFYNNIPKNFNKISYQKEILNKIFPSINYLSSIDFLDMERTNYARKSFIMLLNYCQDHNKNIIYNLQKPVFYLKKNHLYIGNNAIHQLDIINNNTNSNNYVYGKDIKYKSLFDVINKTNTSIGKRFLKDLLTNPILDQTKLNLRYNMIEKFIKYKIHKKIDHLLKGIMDIQRLHRKISLNTLHPFEFTYLNDSYIKILEIYSIFNKYIGKGFTKEDIELLYQNKINNLIKFMKKYNNIFDLEEMSKYNINDITNSFFKTDNYKKIKKIQVDIDVCRNFMNNVKNTFENFIDDKKKNYFDNTVNTCIKLEYNERDKYYLSLTTRRANMIKKKLINQKFIVLKNNKKITIKIDKLKHNIANVSNHFKNPLFKDMRGKSSTTKIFIEEFSNNSNTLLELELELKKLMKEEYINVLKKYYKKYSSLFNNIVDIVSFIDFLSSGAKVALQNNYCKPTIVEKSKSHIDTIGLRHPIIEKIIESEYIPHNIILGKNNLDGILLYGLNSAGKSSLMKAVGLSIILAQIGYYVPAKIYNYHPYNSLFTRISGNDNIFKGLSSYALEITELKSILKRCGENTLVIADEVCKGTEHKSAKIIVMAMLIKFSMTNTSFISATHLHDLVNMKQLSNLHNIKCYHLHVEYNKNKNMLIYDRNMREGSGTNEYGLDVARCIMDDSEFLKIADNIKNDLEGKKNLIKDKTSNYNADIYMTECNICKSSNNLETHHIEFQKNTDDNGFLLKKTKTHIHKNHKSNLVVLCDKCHDKVHDKLIEIVGYKETSSGLKLEINYIKKKSKKKKYNKDIVDYVKKIKSIPHITQKKAKEKIKKEKNINMSLTYISKIWNEKYIII
jgi:DNA mismatch repair protein MutS